MTVLEQAICNRLAGISRELAQVLSAAVLAGRSILILGKHGCGKSTFCSLVAQFFGLDRKKWAYYNAATDDMISLMGLPDVNVQPGEPLRFIPHARAIWNKQLVLIDEITRATPENQNMWLEIVSQGTLKGSKLPCRLLVATCNPSTYVGAFELDQALLDRFAVVCPFPDTRCCPTRVWAQGVLTNLAEDLASEGDEEKQLSLPFPQLDWPIEEANRLQQRFREVRRTLLENERLQQQVAHWVGTLLHEIHAQQQTSISGRTGMALLPKVLYDLWAYASLESPCSLDESRRKRLAYLAVEYALRHKWGLSRQVALSAAEVAWAKHLASNTTQWQILLLRIHQQRPLGERIRLLAQALEKYKPDTLSPEEKTDLEVAVRSMVENERISTRRLRTLIELSSKFSPELSEELRRHLLHREVAEAVQNF